LQLADRQSEESVVSFLGLESDSSRQSGFDSTAVSESTDPGERGTVIGNEISLALSAEGGGLLLTPQVTTSQLCVGLGSSGFGVDLVTQRQGEGSLELVMFSAKEGKVGIDSEAILGGPLVENCLWKGLGDKMESGSSFEFVVAEECTHFDCSSMLLEHNHEGLLLQDKTRDGEGELESYEPLVIAPLAVEGVDRQDGWWKELRGFIQSLGFLVVALRTYCWLCLRKLKWLETSLWQIPRLSIRLLKG
jgi:hypothetical protein